MSVLLNFYPVFHKQIIKTNTVFSNAQEIVQSENYLPHFDPQRFDKKTTSALQLIEIQDFVSVSPVELEPQYVSIILTAFYFLISQLYAALDVIMNMDTATVPDNASKYIKIIL